MSWLIDLIDKQQRQCEEQGLRPYHAPALFIRSEPKLNADESDEARRQRIARMLAFAKDNG